MENIREYFERYKEGIDKIDITLIDRLADKIYECRNNKRNLFIIGNGGSATTADHIACDLAKNTIPKNRLNDMNFKRIRARSLTENVAMLTALANDVGYAEVFSQQLLNYGSRGDMLIAISGSGNSYNVIDAIRTARDLKIYSAGLLGFDGGEARNLVDLAIVYPEKHYGRCEDFHLQVGHILTEELKIKMDENNNGL
jgi:D-sedoheptulose 7-phosphate isomerase